MGKGWSQEDQLRDFSHGLAADKSQSKGISGGQPSGSGWEEGESRRSEALPGEAHLVGFQLLPRGP